MSKTITLSLILYTFMTVVGCTLSDHEAPVSVTWHINVPDINKSNNIEQKFVIKNISNTIIDGDWSIFYSQFPMKSYLQQSSMAKVEQVKGTFHRISPNKNYTLLNPGDSIVLIINGRGEVPGYSMQPEGVYWINGSKGSTPLPIKFHNHPIPFLFSQNERANQIYKENQRIEKAILDTSMIEVIPAVKHATYAPSVLNLANSIHIIAHPDFHIETSILKNKLSTLYGITDDSLSTVQLRIDYLHQKKNAVNEEYYELDVANNKIQLLATTPHGIFNGMQTFLSLLKGQESPYTIQSVFIQDYPDFSYRGHMQDVARNFIELSDLKKLIDILSSYKLNVFRFHFSDDEGWRLQIPGLEELTEIASHRGHTYNESECLYPAYNGDFDYQSKTSGNGFYSRDEFIDLLRYAADRHVAIIPEIESPGHARAAIVAMKARYKKYQDTDPIKAHEYLLHDIHDTSQYVSAQGYSDNVMNVAMPSTYRFMKKVIQEIQLMYKEAGVPLRSIHIGGDEVAEGAWKGSPICKNFMLEHNMTDVQELSDYFIMRIVDFLKEQNIPFSGWQEIAAGHDKDFDRYLSENALGISCWKASPHSHSDELVYQFANKGYPVILCNASNFYFDLAYDKHPNEPGHNWNGYVDESKSFSLLPYSIYRSIRNRQVEKEKTRLTEQGRKNIKGVESALWSETIRNFEQVEYYLFPKIMGLSERGWHASPQWENITGIHEQYTYEKDLSFYYQRISQKEIPYWEKMEVNYRLPFPGLYIDNDGILFANSSIKGGQIRYTTDGTEPTLHSKLWNKPVKCNSNEIKAKLFVGKKQSVTISITNSHLQSEASEANIIYTNANQLQLLGKATMEGSFFHRIDTVRYKDLPKSVKKLYAHSSGLAIAFKTNSTVIKARWTIPNKRQNTNMTPIMQKGLDLYIKKEGEWQYAGVGIPQGIHSTSTLAENMDTSEKACILYLPLYDEITHLEIGVSSDAYLKKTKNPFKGKIIVYGSSITQGASASRPGLAYPSQLSRSSGYQFINMGLSGNGKMESSVAKMLAEIKNVDAFILDCIPNPTADEIRDRTIPFVKTIREKYPDIPVIFIQSVFREKGNVNKTVRHRVNEQNKAIEEQIEKLHKLGYKNLYLIKENHFLGTDHEGTVDGVHPNDLGFKRMVKEIQPVITNILHI